MSFKFASVLFLKSLLFSTLYADSFDDYYKDAKFQDADQYQIPSKGYNDGSRDYQSSQTQYSNDNYNLRGYNERNVRGDIDPTRGQVDPNMTPDNRYYYPDDRQVNYYNQGNNDYQRSQVQYSNPNYNQRGYEERRMYNAHEIDQSRGQMDPNMKPDSRYYYRDDTHTNYYHYGPN